MAADSIPGTAGYAEQADTLVTQYESIAFADLHRPILPLIPTGPGRVLDIGAGTGRDAAEFAARGHDVVAVEPTEALRRRAATLHPWPRIEWLDDALPELSSVTARASRFDVVMLSAVWMHLDLGERRRAMPVVAALLRPGGALFLSLRHGPVPAGRRMFAVTAEETIALAAAEGLRPTLHLERQGSLLPRPDATWTRLAFEKGSPA